MASELHVSLLGEFRVTRDGRELIALHARRRWELLALVILRGGTPLDRARLSFLLWPDSTESQARTNLRQLLHRIRADLPDADRFLAAEGGTIRWREDAPAVVDLHRLREAWKEAEDAAGTGNEERELEALRRAAELYTGDLLPRSYHPRIEEERDRLRRRAAAGMERLVSLLEERRRYAEALRVAERLRSLDPLRERNARTLMRLHALRGDRPRSLAVFGELVELLDRELGVEPDEETLALTERIRDASDRATEVEADDRDRPFPLVGRKREWRAILEAWRRVRRRGPLLLLLTGDPGIGKTRLAQEALAWAGRQGFEAARARAHPGEGELPYAPVAQWLREKGISDSVPALEPQWRAELARVLPDLVPPEATETRDPSPAGDGGWRRLRLFEALARGILGRADPSVLLLDDLQWCDGETLEWLGFLLRFDPRAPLLVLATVRPGEAPTVERLPRWRESLREDGRLAEIPLGPLEPEETVELAESVLGAALEPSQGRALHERTEGNPLFVVEALRAAGPGEPGGGQRVQGIIRYRLEQLTPTARELLAIAAVLGRRFQLDVLADAAAHRFGEEALTRALDELADRHLLREAGRFSYEFSHDRIREVTVEEQGAGRRRLLHRRAAEALERAGQVDPQVPARAVARHFERAGVPDRAILHYRRAADQALAVYAHDEALAHLDRALALLASEPRSRRVKRRELALQIARGVPLVAIHHYAGHPVRAAYGRARELAEDLGEPPDPPVLRALALYSLMRGRIPEVMELGRQLLHQAEERRDPMLRVEAHYVLGVALYWQGRFAAARRHLATSLEHYDPSRARRHLRLYAQDPAIICRTRLALALWHLGEPATARRMVLQTLDEARALEHPFTLAYARYFGSWVLIEAGPEKEARRAVRALVRDASERELAVWPDLALILDGWFEAEGGSPDGLAQMEEAYGRYREEGMNLGAPYHAVLLGRACRRLGRPAEGLAHLDDGVRVSSETGERFWDAELQRMRGLLLHECGARPPEVLEALETALAVARSQGARSLELRAALSLARWRSETGREDPDADLTPVLDTFPPDQESPELDAARSFARRGSDAPRPGDA